MAMKDLKNAADSLNRLVSGLSTNGATPAARPDEPQDDPKGEIIGATMGIEEPRSLESENLRRDVQEKQWELAAKSLKMAMSQQTLGGRIEEPETSHEAKRKKKSLRLVSLLADMGGKRFL